MTILTASDLACWRGQRLVFRGVNLALSAGASLHVTGTNGCGKSSLLRLVAGLVPPLRGHVSLHGQPLCADHLHYIGHLDALKPTLTLTETLALWATLLGANPTTTTLVEVLRKFNLHTLQHQPVKLLSAGQRRRLILCRLLLAPRPIWLLDEPLNALDQPSQDILHTLVAEHRRSGGIILAASHEALPWPDLQLLDLQQYAVAA
jgi:heme exporter protein A